MVMLPLSLEQPSFLYVPGVKERPARAHHWTLHPAPSDLATLHTLPLPCCSSLGGRWLTCAGRGVGWWEGGLMPIGREAERKLAFLCISALQKRKGKKKKKKQSWRCKGTKMMMLWCRSDIGGGGAAESRWEMRVWAARLQFNWKAF